MWMWVLSLVVITNVNASCHGKFVYQSKAVDDPPRFFTRNFERALAPRVLRYSASCSLGIDVSLVCIVTANLVIRTTVLSTG